jgi:hypothetical protein
VSEKDGGEEDQVGLPPTLFWRKAPATEDGGIKTQPFALVPAPTGRLFSGAFWPKAKTDQKVKAITRSLFIMLSYKPT